jgi:hypothetical protein
MDLEGANVLGKKKIWKYSRVTMIMSCGVCPNGRQGEALQKEVIDPNKRFRTKKRNIPIQPNPAFSIQPLVVCFGARSPPQRQKKDTPLRPGTPPPSSQSLHSTPSNLAPPPLKLPLLSLGPKVRLAGAAERTAEVDVQDARIPILVGARRPHPLVAGVADQRDVVVGGLVARVGDGVGEGVLFWSVPCQ